MPEDADGVYYMARIRGGDVAAISSTPPGAPPMAMWNTYVAVADADASAAKVRDAGGTVFMDPFDVMDAGRMAVVADPEGAMFCLWQAKENIGAKVVNEHGALNFNGLATRDPEAAEPFYNAVFGWKILPLKAGPMWVLPGYGDHLEEQTPGLKDNMKQMGAPDGFVDVVAQITPDRGGRQRHARALERHVRRGRRGRDRGEGGRARRRGGCRTVRRAVDPPRRDQGPAGRDVHRRPVRRRERGGRGLDAVSGGAGRGSRWCAPTRLRPPARGTSRAHPSC